MTEQQKEKLIEEQTTKLSDERLKIKKNSDGTINIPLNTKYFLIIATNESKTLFQLVEETIVKDKNNLTTERSEPFNKTKEELIDIISDNNILVDSPKGIKYYQLLEYIPGKGLTSNGVNYY